MSTPYKRKNKDHIETVIFTPITTFDYHYKNDEYDEDDYDDDSGCANLRETPYCCPRVRERLVSYENMDELRDKLFSMYEKEEDGDEGDNHPHEKSQRQRGKQSKANSEGKTCDSQPNTEASSTISSKAAIVSPRRPPPLRSILKHKYINADDDEDDKNNCHSQYPYALYTPASSPTGSPPRYPKESTRTKQSPPKRKNRLVRFLLASTNTAASGGSNSKVGAVQTTSSATIDL